MLFSLEPDTNMTVSFIMQKGTLMYMHARDLDQATHECTMVMFFAVGGIISETPSI